MNPLKSKSFICAIAFKFAILSVVCLAQAQLAQAQVYVNTSVQSIPTYSLKVWSDCGVNGEATLGGTLLTHVTVSEDGNSGVFKAQVRINGPITLENGDVLYFNYVKNISDIFTPGQTYIYTFKNNTTGIGRGQTTNYRYTVTVHFTADSDFNLRAEVINIYDDCF